MRDWVSRLLTCLWLALALAGQSAAAQLPQPQAGNAISASLLPEFGQVRPGETVTLAILMRPKPGWHGYWKNPGDAGIESRVEWTLPPGGKAGPLRYPVPGRLIISGLMNYVYEREHALLVDVHVPAKAAEGTSFPIRARLDYLACTDEICVPESADVATSLAIGPSTAERNAGFDAYRQALPRPLGGEGRFQLQGGTFRLAVPVPASMAISEAYFFPLTDRAIDYAAPQSVSRNGDYLIVETGAGQGRPGAVEGVLGLGDGLGLSLVARPGPVPAAGESLPADTAAAGFSSIIFALGGALLGGLLLNIMPCVFPILSLKALSLAKAGGDEAAARREALAYTAGIVLICLALGGLLLALRAGGAAVGWAFQLQDPRVIMVLLLLVTAIALNLAGLFELPALGRDTRLASSSGAGGAFWTGALAAFVATPCTGPFMGAALGAALVLPISAALAIFAGLGLGLAFPFLLLGFVPPLRRRLPRPGPWLGRFRRLMSVPMFLTALALAWVLGRQTGVDGMTLGLAAATVLALALWWVGRRQGQGKAWLPLAPAALAVAAAILLVPTAIEPAAASPQGRLAAQAFSEARLSALRAEGRPVFVYFTADWCVTCKVNEKAALEQEEVASAFAARNVAVLVGDWTRGDPAIGRFLDRHGRTGVPLYLYYGPGKPAEILPQVLTTRRLAKAVS
ncbi:MAG: thioredoxin family protein [Pseudomonadota bacterium]|nr:thioredoxin family protein [Pseudomonadota bacterium]